MTHLHQYLIFSKLKNSSAKYMNLYLENISDLLESGFSDKRISVILTMILVFYGGLAGPKLPPFVLDLFEKPIFRIFILSLIVYKSNSNPTLSILISIIFTSIMNTINNKKKMENFSQVSESLIKKNRDN